MLSIDDCKKHLKQPDLSEQEIESIKGNLYQLAHLMLDGYLKGHCYDNRETE